MASIDLIDTTEMYLKTIFEMEEDGVVPLRARIVERLGHSGPTVSQTVSRMERDGLVVVREDRRLELQPPGREIAVEVIRKHRLAERLLVDVIGMDWVVAHEEACRWEHVMSEAVEERLQDLLGHPATDPYGNPIPGNAQNSDDESSLDHIVVTDGPHGGIVTRIGEPIQADQELLKIMNKLGVVPGAKVSFTRGNGDFVLWVDGGDVEATVTLPHSFASHLFVSGT